MHQRCCLHLAVEKKKLNILTMLLTGTGNELVDVGDYLDRTPLHYATLADDVKVKRGEGRDSLKGFEIVSYLLKTCWPSVYFNGRQNPH